MIGLHENAVVREMLLVVVRINQALQVAADDCRGLIMLGDGDGLKTVPTLREEDIAPQKVQEVGALEDDLCHPGIIIVCLGDVAIPACLGFLLAHSVWAERAESSAAMACVRTRLLR